MRHPTTPTHQLEASPHTYPSKSALLLLFSLELYFLHKFVIRVHFISNDIAREYHILNVETPHTQVIIVISAGNTDMMLIYL